MDTCKVAKQPWNAELRRVDLRGLQPGGPGWVEACAAVAASMEELGCVVVAHGALDDGELRRDLFGRAMPELFAVPLAVKQATFAGKFMRGYIRPDRVTMAKSVPSVTMPTLENLHISETTDAGKVREFTDLVWPQGNTAFCDTIEAAAKSMLELDQTVQKMVLESLGVRKEHVDAHLASLVYDFRLCRYGALPPPLTTAGGGDHDEDAMSLVAHRDLCVVNTIAQHEVGGLQVQGRDGTWISVAPEPGTFAVIAGELFEVLTNGRVPACAHRVTPSIRERLSALFEASVRHGAVVSALEELVDHDGGHPLRFRPCDFDEYTRFRFGQLRPGLNSALQEFCGTGCTTK